MESQLSERTPEFFNMPEQQTCPFFFPFLKVANQIRVKKPQS